MDPFSLIGLWFETALITRILLTISRTDGSPYFTLLIFKRMNHTSSAFRSARPSHQPLRQDDEHNIYSQSESSISQGERAPPDSDSSFEIEEDENSALDKNKENMEKLLDRLGLKPNEKTAARSQELEAVVSNFLENAIGTVDREANTMAAPNMVWRPGRVQRSSSSSQRMMARRRAWSTA